MGYEGYGNVRGYVTEGGFVPTDIAGCALWLRADMGISLNGSNVSAWADQSGTGDANKNATQGVAGNQPGYNASDAAYNNKPTLSFATDWLRSGVWSSALAQPSTYYVVCSGTSVSTTVIDAENDFSAGRNVMSWNWFHAGNYEIFAGSAANSGVAHTTSPIIFGATFNGSSSAIRISTLTPVAGLAAGAQSMTGITVGADGAVAPSRPLQGKVAEVIAYSGAHDAATVAQVMGYLSARYGITVV